MHCFFLISTMLDLQDEKKGPRGQVTSYSIMVTPGANLRPQILNGISFPRSPGVCCV